MDMKIVYLTKGRYKYAFVSNGGGYETFLTLDLAMQKNFNWLLKFYHKEEKIALVLHHMSDVRSYW